MDLDDRAREILRGNDRGGFTVPTARLYPYQWNWDSAFAAWGFATFDLARGWTELERLFEAQWPSGMVPHIIFRRYDPDYFPGPDVWGAEAGGMPTSGISQPPVAATMVRRLFEMDPEAGRAQAEALLPKLVAWHRWFMDWRTAPDGAVFVVHPWESGRDNAPDWDAAMAAIDPGDVGAYTRRDTSHVDPAMRPTKADYDRYIFLVQRGRRLGWDDAAQAQDAPFRVSEPGMGFILLRANRDLAALAEALGEDRAEIDAWTARLEAGARALWNEDAGHFDSRNELTGARAGALTSAAFLCWYAGLPEPRMVPHLDRILAEVPFPVPSLAPWDARFEGLRYWRGPTWGILNTMIGIGLAEQGLAPQAETLRARTEALLTQHGFAEYFDPHHGTPAGGGTFTWTAAIWLAWVRAGGT